MKNKIALLATISALAVAACSKPAEEAVNEEAAMGKSESEVTFVDCPVADESGNVEIAPGLTARIVKNGYGRAAVEGDYADTNVWLWLYDEAAEDKQGQFIWESGNNVFQFQLGAGQLVPLPNSVPSAGRYPCDRPFSCP